MAYLGHIGNVDVMSVGDDIFIFVLKRWVRYCSIIDWFNTFAGRIAKRVCWRGQWITLKVDSRVAV